MKFKTLIKCIKMLNFNQKKKKHNSKKSLKYIYKIFLFKKKELILFKLILNNL